MLRNFFLLTSLGVGPTDNNNLIAGTFILFLIGPFVNLFYIFILIVSVQFCLLVFIFGFALLL